LQKEGFLYRDRLKAVVTCEHATPFIPAAYRKHFPADRSRLATHRGWDIGALVLARRISRSLASPLMRSRVSRLLVDLNRSVGRPGLFSGAALRFSEEQKILILNQYYFPYRSRVETMARNLIRAGHRVLHLSVHSFTPVFGGKTRGTDIGLLFDPGRNGEREFCTLWRNGIRESRPGLSVHFNRPYRGDSDGLTSAMRDFWPENQYLGIELEVNQKFFSVENRGAGRRIREIVVAALPFRLGESDAP